MPRLLRGASTGSQREEQHVVATSEDILQQAIACAQLKPASVPEVCQLPVEQLLQQAMACRHTAGSAQSMVASERAALQALVTDITLELVSRFQVLAMQAHSMTWQVQEWQEELAPAQDDVAVGRQRGSCK
jgi:hypothetical protein